MKTRLLARLGPRCHIPPQDSTLPHSDKLYFTEFPSSSATLVSASTMDLQPSEETFDWRAGRLIRGPAGIPGAFATSGPLRMRWAFFARDLFPPIGLRPAFPQSSVLSTTRGVFLEKMGPRAIKDGRRSRIVVSSRSRPRLAETKVSAPARDQGRVALISGGFLRQRGGVFPGRYTT